ncbi:MAG: hypothetical protein LBT11_04805, partial [Treponema sp.]|nr:hypothetical protein [Treponema sp.]
MKASVLAVPALEAGRGGGHLARAAALVSALRAVDRDAWLYVPAASAGTLAAFPGNLHAIAKENLRSHTWDWIVLDKFRTSPEEFEFWRSLGSLIGIDEGGPCRDRFDFLLDLLPGLPGRRPPNLSAPVLLPLPKNRKERPFSLPGPNTPLRILVSFGAEDSAGLTVPLCRALRTLAGPERAEISALFGPLYRAGKKAPGIVQNEKMPSIVQNSFVVLQARPELREELADYDLVLSHFGLTAFEALHAGVPVLLASPGPYHEKLARAAGLVSAGIGR